MNTEHRLKIQNPELKSRLSELDHLPISLSDDFQPSNLYPTSSE